MAELVVCGPEPMQRWRRPIPLGEVIRVGRAPRSGWAVPWDALISREHAEVQLVNSQLRVRRLDASRNPIYYQDADNSDFLVKPGEQFRIGRTVFQLVAAEMEEDAPSPSAERSFHPDELRKVAFQNADQRLEVLAKLPKAIMQTTSDEDLASRVVSLVLEAIPSAEAASVVVFDDFSANADPKMIRWDNRGDSLGRFTPSRRLMLKALQLGQGLLHIWATINFLHFCVLLFVICVVICITVSLLTPKPAEAQIVGLTYGTLTAGQKAANKASYGWGEIVASLVVLGIVIGVLSYFTGG